MSLKNVWSKVWVRCLWCSARSMSLQVPRDAFLQLLGAVSTSKHRSCWLLIELRKNHVALHSSIQVIPVPWKSVLKRITRFKSCVLQSFFCVSKLLIPSHFTSFPFRRRPFYVQSIFLSPKVFSCRLTSWLLAWGPFYSPQLFPQLQL